MLTLKLFLTNRNGGALDRLESQKLIERSRPSRGVRLYRVANSKDFQHQRCLQELLTLSESRAGRLELAKQLSVLFRRDLGDDKPSDGRQQMKGKAYV